MPPRRIRKDPKADWPLRADGSQINPNTNEGMLLSGVVRTAKEGVPGVLQPQAYAGEAVPANAAAALASLAQPGDGLLLYKKLPGDCEIFKLHLANERFPEQAPVLAVTCDVDDLDKVLEAVLGDHEAPRYVNPKTGLEFEWTVAPPGFYKPAGGWDEGKTAQDFEDADDERE
ncbi:hypothetical protein M885DRAFT_509689 [Pelagophyceae sp. CCMP2097]|nr:hypothetical protein M885DRAFT_509689 [Pelagophyceae sp. CCMP2097]|mmetsp:Transcript_20518/g.69544  ORF Transcript_20518/g.69544 Transcript_20518/m.69544 type:complete len:173 (+) Transcript_20518:47-565(+)